MTDETRRERLLAEIRDTEPAMFRAMGPANAKDWIAIELTMSQLKVAFLLYTATLPHGADGLRVSEVARSLGVTLPTVTSVMDKLVERGLIRRDEDPIDRRQHVCRLTPEGRQLIERLAAGRRAYTSKLLAYLDDEALATVLEGMKLLIRAAECLHAGAPPVVEGPGVAEKIG
ncbi:MAG: MarR family transcriptional regulator [Chloroflexota bacterium]|nr:MarR family transcriptional regulator [Chloroflexota bacterium]